MKTVRPPKGTSHYRLVCKKDECAAALEVEKGELEFKSDPRDGDAYVLKCPHCGTETWFAATEIRKYAVKPST